MATKKILLGMLVIALVFGIMVIGCDDNMSGFVDITNGTPFDITYVVFTSYGGFVEKSDPIGIKSGQKKEYKFDSKFSGDVTVTVSVNNEAIEVTRIFVSAAPGYNSASGTSINLSGNSKETLTF